MAEKALEIPYEISIRNLQNRLENRYSGALRLSGKNVKGRGIIRMGDTFLK